MIYCKRDGAEKRGCVLKTGGSDGSNRATKLMVRLFILCRFKICSASAARQNLSLARLLYFPVASTSKKRADEHLQMDVCTSQPLKNISVSGYQVDADLFILFFFPFFCDQAQAKLHRCSCLACGEKHCTQWRCANTLTISRCPPNRARRTGGAGAGFAGNML